MIAMKFRNWKRVSKRTAEKLYNQGTPILMCPCRQSPVSYFSCAYTAQNDTGYQFWETVMFFQKYECNPELGRYPAYYVGVEE